MSRNFIGNNSIVLTEKFLQDCAERIESLAKKVKETTLQEKVTITIKPCDFEQSYPDEKIKSMLGGCKKYNYIYVFRLDESANKEKIYDRFVAEKKRQRSIEKNSQDRRAFCKANKPSNTLYVGSSSNLDSRFRQHFGDSAKTTYSMQLRHWFDFEDFGGCQITIDVWRFDCLEKQVLQEIEDKLWDELKPMLGKQGGR